MIVLTESASDENRHRRRFSVGLLAYQLESLLACQLVSLLAFLLDSLMACQLVDL